MPKKLHLVWRDTPEQEARSLAAIERARGFSESAVAQSVRKFWNELS